MPTIADLISTPAQTAVNATQSPVDVVSNSVDPTTGSGAQIADAIDAPADFRSDFFTFDPFVTA
jgi:hypothetical protein